MPLRHSLTFPQNIFHCGVKSKNQVSWAALVNWKWNDRTSTEKTYVINEFFPLRTTSPVRFGTWMVPPKISCNIKFKKKKKRSKLKVTWDKWYLELQLAKIWSLGLVYEFNKNFPIGLLSCCFIWLRWQHIAPS